MKAKLRSLVAPLLFMCPLVLIGCSQTVDETKPFQGSWKVSEVGADGKKSDKEATFENDSFQIFQVKTGKTDSSIEPGLTGGPTTFRVDNSKNPKEIEFVSLDGDDQGKTRPGIFEFEGQTLRICVAKGFNDPRPAAFNANAKAVLWTMEKKN
jgi:uncharacterized protein (TIGR03067 family)